ncbi:MAG: hypothetical protein ILA24_06205 [Ruminococcus sp.]|nr:hypothetical protein [Ruminococcus sp.]
MSISYKENLIKYLQSIVELEKAKYEQECIISKLDSGIRKYSNPPLTQLKETKVPSKNDAPLTSFLLGVGATVLLILALWFIGGTDGDKGILDTVFNSIPVLIARLVVIFLYISAIIALVKMAAEGTEINESLHKEYEEALVYNRKAEDSNNRIKKQYNDILSKYKKDRTLFNNDLFRTRNALEKYYSLNIIHPKYWGFVPIASILEYFQTGVCTELEGHEGAYNKYDQEMLLKAILGKLDDVLANLEQIKNNQRLLYNAIMDSNRNVNNLLNKVLSSNERIVQAVNQQGQTISGHLSAIEYSNSINALNTSIIADIEMFQWLARK